MPASIAAKNESAIKAKTISKPSKVLFVSVHSFYPINADLSTPLLHPPAKI
jgi:hypothetical protein